MGKFIKELVKSDNNSSSHAKKFDSFSDLGIDLSDIDFSFLENEDDFNWRDASVKEQKEIGIQAYSKFAF